MSIDQEDDYFRSTFISEYWEADALAKIETKRVYLEVIKTLDGLSYALFMEKRLQRRFEGAGKALKNLGLVIKIYVLMVAFYLAGHFLRDIDPPASDIVAFLVLTSLFLGFVLIQGTVNFNHQDAELKQLNFKRIKFEDDAIKFRDYYGLSRLIDIELKKIRETDVYSIHGQYDAPNDFTDAEVSAQFKSAILSSIQSNSF